MTEAELWREVEFFFQKKFAVEKNAPLEMYLFLIGVQELGSGKQKYTKDDKLNILHIAVCNLLEPLGYYKFSHYDKDGYPHFDVLAPLPELKPNEQTLLMKKAIIQYFIKENLFSEEVILALGNRYRLLP
ncbi:MAG: hypothetical protein FDW93_04605 [Bergeyella sp.]|nr:hypothetical protein [Bergeyella sp.]